MDANFESEIHSMAQQPDMIGKEISANGLTKRAAAILQKCDKLIDYYNQPPFKPKELALFRDDFRHLAEQVAKGGHNIHEVTYRGYGIKKYGDSLRFLG